MHGYGFAFQVLPQVAWPGLGDVYRDLHATCTFSLYVDGKGGFCDSEMQNCSPLQNVPLDHSRQVDRKLPSVANLR